MTGRFISAITPPANQPEPAYWFAFAGNRLLCYEDSTQVIPLLADFSEFGLEPVRQHYLGTMDGRPCYAVELAEPGSLPAGLTLEGLRQAAARLEESFFALAGRAVQIVDWDRTHQFCGRCGAKTDSLETERGKKCPECGLVNYPRLSPSIIVAVRRDAELLLARSPHFVPGVYSVLAGFVEPGETLEQAVEREVFEEVAVKVKNITYFGSQPWPFPNSLMIGFMAEYAGGELRPDPSEIEDAGWYAVDKLPSLPSKISIARRLVNGFIAWAESSPPKKRLEIRE
jgi:NAD+ diphosphatase